MGEALKELGKHFLNLAVAVIVFMILQPLVSPNISNKFYLIGMISYLIIVISGFFLIIIGKKLEDIKNE